MFNLHFTSTNHSKRKDQIEHNRGQTSSVDVRNMQSQQEPKLVCGVSKNETSHTIFSIEVHENIYKRLSDLADKEEIPVKALTSELLKTMLILHHRELRQIIEAIKKRNSLR